MNRRFLLAASAALALGTGFAAPAAAQAVDFKGKTITIVIPFGVGGGSDVWGRFNATLLQKHLPVTKRFITWQLPHKMFTPLHQACFIRQ